MIDQKPPQATATGVPAPGSGCPAVLPLAPLTLTTPQKLTTLTKRSDFTRAAAARRQSAGSFLLQARKRDGAEAPDLVRVGYTCSKKVGNAVTRNRAKRRLRAAARAVLMPHGRPGWDYVLVGRPGATVDRLYALLITDLQTALTLIHAKP